VGSGFGVCNLGQGIHNIDLNKEPYCCACDAWKPNGFDELALVPQWHKDEWAGFKIPCAQQIDLDLAILRCWWANFPSYRPIVAGGMKRTPPESYFVEQDAEERGN